jgi:hypothetical protein
MTTAAGSDLQRFEISSTKVPGPLRSDQEHLAAVATAFFAPGNDPSVWIEGWRGIAAAGHGSATTNQPVEHWWGAGGKDLFVVQPLHDVMAVRSWLTRGT